ncbi:MAG: hypothetical protein OEU26_19925, partial [Candidatus Tectomicrobia bacterium]|nr:hypothetical protein [Candidatus Tectomicrobia bacterium]
WVLELEQQQVYEVSRGLSEGQLVKSLLVYGKTKVSEGRMGNSSLFRFTDDPTVGPILAVQVDATMLRYDLQGCDTAGSEPSKALIGLISTLRDINKLNSEDQTGDTQALLRIFRLSNSSADDAALLAVEGAVMRCLNTDCSIKDEQIVSLGAATLGTLNTYALMWDTSLNQVLFSQDGVSQGIPYMPLTAIPPSVVSPQYTTFLITRGEAANCTIPPDGLRPFAFVEAAYDNVLITR